MNPAIKKKTNVLLMLSLLNLPLQLLLFRLVRDVGRQELFSGLLLFNAALICVLAPLIGVFAANDYSKTASKQEDVSYAQGFFLAALAINVIGSIVGPIWQGQEEQTLFLLLVIGFFQFAFLSFLLITTRSKIFGMALAAFVILIATSLVSMTYCISMALYPM